MSRYAQFLSRLLVLLLGGFALRTDGVPRVPTDDDEVLERVPRVVGWHAARARSVAARAPDAAVAVAEARRWLELNRAEADPRYLGRAQAVLAPWWQQKEPPIEILLLRATVRQSLHDFSGALADLDQLLRVDPSNAQAWLIKSSIHTLRGEWSEACDAVVPLTRLTSRLVSTAAAASVLCVRGQAMEASRLLRGALLDEPSAPTAVRLWAWTLLGEIATGLERDADAEECFREALKLGHRDAYLVSAYSDFLLGRQRFAEAAVLLEPWSGSDNLLLRLAIAESHLTPRPEAFARHLEILGERFAAARSRGEATHQREEARYQLELQHDPRTALELARANWKVQKEPADTKILLESALAVQDATALDQVREWLDASRLEDRRLRRLLESQPVAPR